MILHNESLLQSMKSKSMIVLQDLCYQDSATEQVNDSSTKDSLLQSMSHCYKAFINFVSLAIALLQSR
jgi:hypothetical protein